MISQTKTLKIKPFLPFNFAIIKISISLATTWFRHKYKYEICIFNKTYTHNKNEKATEIVFANIMKIRACEFVSIPSRNRLAEDGTRMGGI